MTFHDRPRLDRSRVVLRRRGGDDRAAGGGGGPPPSRLLASGQHLKRGLLLYGPPGTGKTHTVRYLLGRTPEVIIISGVALHPIAEACSVARELAPAMVVVEDVDLIAEDREYPGQHPLLFQLLNEMDGLADDADVAFVLTTNRADVLERALAARPGRVDQAVELACRTPRPGGRCWSSTGGAWSWTPRTWTASPRRPRGSPPPSSRSCCAGRR